MALNGSTIHESKRQPAACSGSFANWTLGQPQE